MSDVCDAPEHVWVPSSPTRQNRPVPWVQTSDVGTSQMHGSPLRASTVHAGPVKPPSSKSSPSALHWESAARHNSPSAQSAVDRAFALKGGRRANATDSQVLAKSKALASHKALADKQKRLAAAQADAPPPPPGAENAKPRRFF